MLFAQIVMLCISIVKSSQTLPMSILNLEYAVSKAKFSCPPFLNLLPCSISFSTVQPLTLESSETVFVNTTLLLLLHLLLWRWIILFSTVMVLIHSGSMVKCITRWVLYSLEMVSNQHMLNCTSMMTRLLLLHATQRILTVTLLTSSLGIRPCE